jgi:hypothetical protein
VLAASLGSGVARAGSLDPDLLHLCPPHTPAKGTLGGLVPECSWVKRGATGRVDSLTIDVDSETRFRSLMSELGVALAPRLLVPAQTLGSAGFQISGEVGTTSISNGQPFWNGVAGVQPENPSSGRPGGWLTTVGLFVRKGLWVPLPAVEVGAGVIHLLDSRLLSWQGYAKLALLEGYNDWPLPSLAVRGSGAYVTGSDQVRLKLAPVDFTPSCDAYFVRTAMPGQTLGDYCAESQRGSSNDSLATAAFPNQDAIIRHRFFGGAKLKFAAVFASIQYEIVPSGNSRDENKPNGARDASGKQEGLSLSAGFDF